MDLDLLAPGRGRPGVPLTGHVVRDLSSEDITLLQTLGPGRKAAAPTITRLRDSHHQVARYVAQGFDDREVSLHTGFTPERVWQLRQDPSFQDLCEVYRKELRDAQLDVVARLGGLAVDVIQEIHERVQDRPEEMTTSQLTEVAKLTLDRIGFGPQSRNTNVNVNVDLAGKLEQARRRAKLVNGPD